MVAYTCELNFQIFCYTSREHSRVTVSGGVVNDVEKVSGVELMTGEGEAFLWLQEKKLSRTDG